MRLKQAFMIWILYGCSTTATKEQNDKLDISPISENKDLKPKVDTQSIIDWKEFFRPLPTEKERSILAKKLSVWPDTAKPGDLINKARMEVALSQYKNAETSLRQAVRLDSKSIEAKLDLVSVFLRLKDTPSAFEFLTMVRDQFALANEVKKSELIKYRYLLAQTYLSSQDHERAHRVLSDLIGYDKSFAPAYIALAESYMAQGKNETAEFVIGRGLDRIGDTAAFYALKGVLADRTGQLDEGLLAFDKALELTPNFVPALIGRAAINAQRLDYTAAEADLGHALSLKPDAIEALIAIGIIHRKKGNITAAKAALTRALDESPENLTARYNLAVLYADELSRPEEAVRLFNEVVQSAREDSELSQLSRSYIGELKGYESSYQ